jgi:hypothetical protein
LVLAVLAHRLVVVKVQTVATLLFLVSQPSVAVAVAGVSPTVVPAVLAVAAAQVTMPAQRLFTGPAGHPLLVKAMLAVEVQTPRAMLTATVAVVAVRVAQGQTP